MTDNEIIKALECCLSDTPPCTTCKYDNNTITVDECMGDLMKDALDLIKRQQAEIEQLRQLFVESGKEQDRLMAEIERLEEDKENLYVIGYNLGKNEAIKDFAERLHELLKFYYPEQKFVHTHIDNLVKEMTEER